MVYAAGVVDQGCAVPGVCLVDEDAEELRVGGGDVCFCFDFEGPGEKCLVEGFACFEEAAWDGLLRFGVEGEVVG